LLYTCERFFITPSCSHLALFSDAYKSLWYILFKGVGIYVKKANKCGINFTLWKKYKKKSLRRRRLALPAVKRLQVALCYIFVDKKKSWWHPLTLIFLFLRFFSFSLSMSKLRIFSLMPSAVEFLLFFVLYRHGSDVILSNFDTFKNGVIYIANI
jgi:hypothetical protein